MRRLHQTAPARPGRESSGKGVALSPPRYGVGPVDALVQRDAQEGAHPAGVHAAARAVTRGPGGPLPYFDKVQAAFGDHDLSGVVAHTGAMATAGTLAMGARGFATGRHVAFAGSPSLRVVAHEAAHVVQQRAGVHMDNGGVGRPGDRWERHADQVADAVVAGRSAAPLLSGLPTGPAGGEQVQLYRRVGTDDRSAFSKWVDANVWAGLSSFLGTTSKVDGDYTMEEGASFPSQVKGEAGNWRTRVDKGAKEHPPLLVSEDSNLAVEDTDQPKAFYATEAIIAQSNQTLEAVGTPFRLYREQGSITVPTSDGGTKKLYMTLPENQEDETRGLDMMSPHLCNEISAKIMNSGDGGKSAVVGDELPGGALAEDLNETAKVAHIGHAKAMGKDAYKSKDTSHSVSDSMAQGNAREAHGLSKADRARYDQVMRSFGLNEGASPDVGGAFVTASMGWKDLKSGKDFSNPANAAGYWVYHWGGVVARSGNDVITLENYDRTREDGRTPDPTDTRYFFKMYGSEKKGQSFHEQQAKTGAFANPVTVAFRNGRRGR